MKYLVMLFSLVSYVLFLGVFVYLVLFVGGGFLSAYVPFLEGLKTVDSGVAAYSILGLSGVAGNLILLLAFGVQHSVMARKTFKNALTKIVPEAAERSVFVFATSVVLMWLYMVWAPMPGTVWHMEGAWGVIMTLLFLAGAGLVLWSTFMINHFELFGLAQAWRFFKDVKEPDANFREPALYKVTRHPLYVGILMVFWATPTMTVGHLFFASIWTAYVFIGIGYEERDLIDTFGDKYKDYMNRVPQLLPFGKRK